MVSSPHPDVQQVMTGYLSLDFTSISCSEMSLPPALQCASRCPHDQQRPEELLHPAAMTLTWHPVDLAVGNTRNEGPELIEPIEEC